ncbi:MAG: hypothetical protein AABY22_10460 [Nanoarchaeota archaeon]
MKNNIKEQIDRSYISIIPIDFSQEINKIIYRSTTKILDHIKMEAYSLYRSIKIKVKK